MVTELLLYVMFGIIGGSPANWSEFLFYCIVSVPMTGYDVLWIRDMSATCIVFFIRGLYN